MAYIFLFIFLLFLSIFKRATSGRCVLFKEANYKYFENIKFFINFAKQIIYNKMKKHY